VDSSVRFGDRTGQGKARHDTFSGVNSHGYLDVAGLRGTEAGIIGKGCSKIPSSTQRFWTNGMGIITKCTGVLCRGWEQEGYRELIDYLFLSRWVDACTLCGNDMTKV